MKIKFNKEDDNKWYVDLPEWEGSHAELEMVYGADLLLDIISGYKRCVELNVSINSFELIGEYMYLDFVEMADDIGNGAYYYFDNQLKVGDTTVAIKMWLCDVMKFVFGYFPHRIYFQIIK